LASCGQPFPLEYPSISRLKLCDQPASMEPTQGKKADGWPPPRSRPNSRDGYNMQNQRHAVNGLLRKNMRFLLISRNAEDFRHFHPQYSPLQGCVASVSTIDGAGEGHASAAGRPRAHATSVGGVCFGT